MRRAPSPNGTECNHTAALVRIGPGTSLANPPEAPLLVAGAVSFHQGERPTIGIGQPQTNDKHTSVERRKSLRRREDFHCARNAASPDRMSEVEQPAKASIAPGLDQGR